MNVRFAGGLCLLTPDSSLFYGDIEFSRGSVGRWDLDTGYRDQLHESVGRPAAMDVKRLYPGHDVSVEENASGHLAMNLKYLKFVGRYA